MWGTVGESGINAGTAQVDSLFIVVGGGRGGLGLEDVVGVYHVIFDWGEDESCCV